MRTNASTHCLPHLPISDAYYVRLLFVISTYTVSFNKLSYLTNIIIYEYSFLLRLFLSLSIGGSTLVSDSLAEWNSNTVLPFAAKHLIGRGGAIGLCGSGLPYCQTQAAP